jgi:hypothetical protein
MESSQKVKELTYMHCEGIMAGELKHGPLALVDDLMPIVMIVMRDGVYVKTINAIQQVKARGGLPIVICEAGDKETEQFASKILEVPKTVDCLQVRSFPRAQELSLTSPLSGRPHRHPHATAVLPHRRTPRLQRRLPQKSRQVGHRRVIRAFHHQLPDNSTEFLLFLYLLYYGHRQPYTL